MIDTNQPNGEPRQQLLRQQRTEWNHLLGLETATRLALFARQQRESLQEQEGTINVHQRIGPTRQHQGEREALRQQDRQNRMATLERHSQEAAL